MYLIRLDDASDRMDTEKWNRMEAVLDGYGVKPIVGVIPQNKDSALIGLYKENPSFWKDTVRRWQDKGWCLAMHGYEHVYTTASGGINPVNKRSEFAGLDLDEQKRKIHEGYAILKKKGIQPKIFFAPSHTFDKNTLEALRTETDIRIISDTVAFDVYFEGGFYFIPQQSGHVRKLPFKIVTFCYHPNIMNDRDFSVLEEFLKKYTAKFGTVDSVLKKRKRTLFDALLRNFYFAFRYLRRI